MIPVIANGDITTPEKARHVLEYTRADAVMIGRAAQGRPWIFREIEHYLKTGTHLLPPEVEEIHRVLVAHQRPGRVGGIPARDEPVADLRRTARRGRCVFRGTGRIRPAAYLC